MLSFEVPGNCVPKQRPRLGRGGHTYTPKRTLDYEKKVAALALQAGAKPSKERLKLRVIFYFSDKKKRDIDNCIKSILDGLNKVAWEDDEQIQYLSARKYNEMTESKTFIEIGEYNGTP